MSQRRAAPTVRGTGIEQQVRTTTTTSSTIAHNASIRNPRNEHGTVESQLRGPGQLTRGPTMTSSTFPFSLPPMHLPFPRKQQQQQLQLQQQQQQQQQQQLQQLQKVDEESLKKARHDHNQQLLTEHFGFTPISFVDDIINSVNNMIYQASMAVEEFIKHEMTEIIAHKGPPHEDFDVEIETAKCMHKFETLLEASVDKNFDRFELYALNNIFAIPENVDIVLPHYEALDFGITAERELQLDRELEILRQKIIAAKALNYKLRKRLEIEEKQRRQLQVCRDQIQFLKDAINSYQDVTPVPQTLIFVRDNIETLYQRFKSLHERLERNASTLDSSGTGIGTGTGAGVTSSPSSHKPKTSVTSALYETLLNMEPDARAIYIQSVVRRQIDKVAPDLLNSNSHLH